MEITLRVILYLLFSMFLLASVMNTAHADEFTQRELTYMLATLQIELFKRGDISPVDILKAQKAEYNPAIWTSPLK